MANKTLNLKRVYRFKATNLLYTQRGTFAHTFTPSWTSLNAVDWTNGKSIEISEYGVDSTGVFYKYKESEQLPNGTWSGVGSATRVNIDTSTEEFEMEIIGYTGGSSNVAAEEIFNAGFEPIPVELIQIDHVTATMTLTGFDDYSPSGVDRYIDLHLVPDSDYKFISTDIPVIIHEIDKSGPPTNSYGYKDVTVDQSQTTIYTSTLNLDGTMDIRLTVTNNSVFLGILSVRLGDLVGKLVKDSYNVELTNDGCSFSNTSTSASTNTPYVNVITANVGYTLDEINLFITMGGEEVDLATVYDPITHTITISQVTGDIVISASANKLHTFNFYSKDGLTLYATLTAIRITSVLTTLTGSTRKLYVNGSLIATYTSAIPSQYSLMGWAYTSNATRFVIPLDVDFGVVYTSDTNFYECIIPTPDIPTGLNVVLYQCSAERNRVDKSNYLSIVANDNGTLRTACSIHNPVIDIEHSGFLDANYCYVPQFKRYYFIKEIRNIVQDLYQVVMECDVLMSFKEDIRKQYAFINRNQITFDREIVDNKRVYENKPQVDYIELPTSIFEVSSSGLTISGNDKSGRFVLTVVGGNE